MRFKSQLSCPFVITKLSGERGPGMVERHLDLESEDLGASPHPALNCLCDQVQVT